MLVGQRGNRGTGDDGGNRHGQRIERRDQGTRRIAHATEGILDLAALLHGYHPHRHSAGQAGGDVGELHRQLAHRLLVLAGGNSSQMHGFAAATQAVTLLGKFGVVEVKALGIEQT
ncbi:hypothetical protein FQZ97_843610 [compost metagenome]